VVVVGDGQQATIESGKTETVEITDTYSFVGSLLVRKTIAGPAAGQQGPITIHSECDGTALTPDFVITEKADTHTSTVSVVVTGSGQTVTVSPGKSPKLT
jgi:hypothetical protein